MWPLTPTFNLEIYMRIGEVYIYIYYFGCKSERKLAYGTLNPSHGSVLASESCDDASCESCTCVISGWRAALPRSFRCPATKARPSCRVLHDLRSNGGVQKSCGYEDVCWLCYIIWLTDGSSFCIWYRFGEIQNRDWIWNWPMINQHIIRSNTFWSSSWGGQKRNK